MKYPNNKGDNILRSLGYLASLLFCLVVLSSCGPKTPPPLPTPQWIYAKDGITLHFKADNLLNMNDDNPHTLLVCLYQLRDKSMFEQLAGNEDGIYQLLDGESFGDSVSTVKRLFIQPKEDLSIVMDRLAGTRYLGIVAGYVVLQKERMIRIIDIPILYTKNNSSAVVGPLKLTVNLGSEQIAAIRKN